MSIILCEKHGRWDSDDFTNCPSCDDENPPIEITKDMVNRFFVWQNQIGTNYMTTSSEVKQMLKYVLSSVEEKP